MPCCCLARSECVIAVSIYGISISAALLSVLGLHGHDFGPGFSIMAEDILHKVALSTYAVCLVTNILLLLGLLLPERLLLLPWLVSHLLLVVALLPAASYYLVLYTTVECWDNCTVLLGLR